MIRQILRGARDVETGSGKPPLQAVARPPIRWLDPPAGPWTVERAYQYCEEFVRAHTESYPVASRFVPTELRPHVVALYAFARSADDFADEPEYEGRRVEALDRWEEALNRCSHGEADHPVFVALCDTIERRDLPIPPLFDMLTAFRMDMEVRRYATFQSLRGYTLRSADPVGRLLLALFGYRDPALVRYADELSTALQLTNFWQDAAADAARDHIYLPAEDLHHFDVTEADLKALKMTPALRDLLRFQVTRTRGLYERGRPLLEKVGGDLRMELTLIWLVGNTILDKIEAADYDVFAHRPSIRRRDQAVIMARAAKEWASSKLDLGALRALWP
ncbi:MAG TPA: squalene synthase HpnC [Polyangia bacterium]|nr:squalene synthase HpnC [Polyangia bacterium]